MGNRSIDAALDSSVEDPVARHVLLCLANRANDEEGLCWPSLETLGMDTGLHRSTIQRALAGLVVDGHLSYADGSRSAGGRSPTRYRFHPRACQKRAAKKEARRIQRGEKLLPGFMPEGSLSATPAVAHGYPSSSAQLPQWSLSATPAVAHSYPSSSAQLPQGSLSATPAVAHSYPSSSAQLPQGSLSATRSQIIPKGTQSDPSALTAFSGGMLSIPAEFEEGLRGALAGWLASKAARGRSYDGTSWQAFLDTRVRPFPAAAVIKAIEEATGRDVPWQDIFPGRHAEVQTSEADFGPKKIKAPPEPNWDWRADFVDRYDMDPGEWGDLIPAVQSEMYAIERARAEQQKEGRAA